MTLKKAKGDGELLRHVGLIPDGNRTWAKHAGASVENAYKLASVRLGEFLECAFAFPKLEAVSLYLLSAKNTNRPREELEAFLQSGITFGEQILPKIIAEHNLRLSLVWIDSLQQSLVGKVDDKQLHDFIGVFVHLSNLKPDLKARRLYCLLAYDPLEELARANRSRKPHGHSIRYDDLSVPIAVDLVIRTGSRRRLSGFLPLQTAEADLSFNEKQFPLWTREDTMRAMTGFAREPRTFGL